MKSKTKQEIQELDKENLKKRLADLTKQISSNLYDKHLNQQKNTRETRNLKREKAVVLTVLHGKEQVHGK